MSELQIRELYAGYGDITVLNNLEMDVEKGEVVALVGANGAGKSTLLRTISGLITPNKGQITFMGRRIDHMMPHQVVEMGFIQVPEGKQLFPEMTVEENLMVGSFNKRARKDRERSLKEAYEFFPILEERRQQKARSLSGGEQQMLALGRALMGQPKLLAMDEPSLGLAPIIVERLFNTIQNIRKTGLTILIIEQNVQQALEMADRGYVIENGHIVLEGKGSELLQNEHLKTHYLGI
ncbi:MAG: ABC transporter ATP-binding protein [Deltaproteobacteria bacterium]|nr:ABC transporter ATP-binding protein [Deltaproteobacteria bacterium]